MPGARGGSNWGSTASNPEKGMVYVMTQDWPSFYKLSEAPAGGRQRRGRSRLVRAHLPDLSRTRRRWNCGRAAVKRHQRTHVPGRLSPGRNARQERDACVCEPG